MGAIDLHGPVAFRKLQIETAVWKNAGTAITPNTHVHLGARNGDTLVLAFRGTDLPVRFEDVNLKRLWGFWGNLWTDFSFGLTTIDWPNVELPNVISRGALATLCALWCSIRWPDKDITCVTLGSPRVGNQDFVNEFTYRHIQCYRLVQQYDPIPTVPDRYSQVVPIGIPPSHPGLRIRHRKYRHAGESLSLWQHVGGEIVLRGLDPPDLNDEEMAGNLSIPVDIALRLEGWVPYWSWRGARILWNLPHHNASHCARTVQRIVEKEGKPFAPPPTFVP
ncbi:alpha beta-hydrolase [Fusarium oxysporum]|nr:alpha beta-hydrolase [Fusarium oxysporum]